MIGSLTATTQHFSREVLPRVTAYEKAEIALSRATFAGDFDKDDASAIAACSAAFDLAVALDGLADRLAADLSLASRKVALGQVRPLCRFYSTPRPEALDRNTGVAVAYKHFLVADQALPIASLQSILCAGLGYGLDGFGVGKASGPEVIAWDRSGVGWKFSGDAVAVLAGWSDRLSAHDANFIPPEGLFLGLPLRLSP